jgi:hypothetical protein
MPNDTQIFSGAVHDGNSDYTLPGGSEIRVKAVQATFNDNGAGADWCPAVVMISDSGHVIARGLLRDVKVTAGDDAEVSWFPGVKPGGGVTGVASGFFSGYTGISPIIPSGVSTELGFGTWVSGPGVFPPVAFTAGVTAHDFSVLGHRVFVELTVVFPAANYDRYIEIDQAGSTTGFPLFVPTRVRSQVSPDGDSLSVSAVVTGFPSAPAPLQLNVFQASGVNRAVQAYVGMYGWPIPEPQESWV